MKNQDFNFFVPIDISKAGAGTDYYKNMIIGGVASTSDVDADGEILEPNGFDLSILKVKGTINWEHGAKNSALNIIGEPIDAEIRDNKLFLKAKLYEKMPRAREAYDTMLAMRDSGATRKLGFSIEGKPIQRDPHDPKRITKALITNIALCTLPKNGSTFADVLKGHIVPKEELDYDIPTDVDYLFKGTFGDSEFTIHNDFTITKAMSAGAETGQSLVGKDTSGAALKTESLDPDLKVLTIPVSTIKWSADNWDSFQKDTKKGIQKALKSCLKK